MKYEELKRFINIGINGDVDPSLMPEDAVYELKNAVIDEVLGALVNAPGTQSHAYAFPSLPGPSLNAKCLGAVEWREEDALVYCVVLYSTGNTTGYDYILKYDRTTETNTLITSYSGLNFDTRYPIRHAGIVDGVLFISDGLNPVRKIDIEDAINGTYAVNEQFINAAQIIPRKAPSVAYGSDQSYNKNNVRGSQFQFCYRWIMQDSQVTSTSDISSIVIPPNDEDTEGFVDEITQNNHITVGVLEGTELVRDIEIFVREGNDGDWLRIVKMNKDDYGILSSESGVYVYKFYNDKALMPVDQDEISRINDGFPILADTLNILEEGRLVLGGITEGREQTNVDVEMNPRLEEMDFGVQDVVSQTFDITTGTDGGGDYLQVEVDSASINNYVPAAKSAVSISGIVEIFVDADRSEFEIIDDTMVYSGLNEEEEFAKFLGGLFQRTGLFRAYYPSTNTVRFYYLSNLRSVKEAITLTSATVVYEYDKARGFKLNSSHPIGIVYFDKYGRNGGVCTTPGMDINMSDITGFVGRATSPVANLAVVEDEKQSWHVDQWVGYTVSIAGESRTIVSNTATTLTVSSAFPTLTPSYQTYRIYVGDGASKRGVIEWKINNTPPIWADRWAFVYAGNKSVLSWIQYPIDGISDGTAELAEYSKVDILSLNQHKAGSASVDYSYPDSIIDPISLDDIGLGLRMRFLREATGVSGTIDNTFGIPLMSEFDFEIVGYQDDDPTTNILLVKKFDHASNNIGIGSLVEIYQPALEVDEKIYYGTGYAFDIGNPGLATRYHEGEFQDQNIATGDPATGRLINGDAFYFPRSLASNLTLSGAAGSSRIGIVESQNASDLYESDSYSKGKPFIILDNARTQKYPIFRWSNKYFSDTEVNGLNVFESANRTKQLDNENGDIKASVVAGKTLRVFQSRKTSTVYIGRIVLQSDGIDADSVATTNNVLGTITPHIGDYGTVFPNSVSSSGNWTYFFDIYVGKMFRMATNGVFDISAYGAKNYFRDKSKALIASGIENVDVLTVYAERYDSLIVSFVDHADSSNSETILFHEPSNKWYTFWEINPTLWTTIGDYLISFNGGALWEHGTSNRMNFYGSQKSFEVTVVSNVNPNKIRTLDSIAIETNKNKYNASSPSKSWSVSEVIVPATSQYPSGQFSRIPASRFVSRDGRLYSDFLRDAYTTTGAELITDYINGQKMTSNFFLIKLIHQDTSLVLLKSLKIISTDLELS